MTLTITRTLAVAGLACLLLPGCGAGTDPLRQYPRSGSAGGKAVVVGSASATESTVVAELYAQALTAKGMPASTRLNLGSRDVYLKALTDGTVSIVPEYTGQLLFHYDEDATATTAAEVAQELPKVLPSDLTLGRPAKAVNQDVYLVTKRFSQRYGVTSLAHLSKVAGGVVLGGPSDLTNRPYGPAGLRQIYGATIKQFKPYDSAAVRSRGLDKGSIQVGEFHSTESAIAGQGYVALTDPQAMILPQNVVPVLRTEVAADPTVGTTLDAVQSALTTEELAALDRRVDVDHDAPNQVAAAWLQGKGLS
ncbi:ABC transporter substrate-binding protein [uncultured Friedmanniella sp.]|uniref:ABC transporter substrate-binding protein n=1 Tax=uncultured Friedmanniella sp. TaxID=335381 RepID=UPI0035C96DFC